MLVNPDSGIKTFKDLEGKKVLTTAGAGVNTLFPVAGQNAGVDVSKIELTNVAESALVRATCRAWRRRCWAASTTSRPRSRRMAARRRSSTTRDYGVYQPGYAIVAHKDMVKDNPDLVRRFVRATLQASEGGQANPDEAIQSLINW